MTAVSLIGAMILTAVPSADELAGFALVAVILMPIPSSMATGYLWHVYLSDTRTPRSWLLLALALSATIALLGTGIIAVVPFVVAEQDARRLLMLGGGVLLESIPLMLAGAILYGRRFRYRSRRPRRKR